MSDTSYQPYCTQCGLAAGSSTDAAGNIHCDACGFRQFDAALADRNMPKGANADAGQYDWIDRSIGGVLAGKRMVKPVTYEPTTSVYIVMSDSTSLMVFSDEGEACLHAERFGGEVLPVEPVFDTSDHCAEWCGLDEGEAE